MSSYPLNTHKRSDRTVVGDERYVVGEEGRDVGDQAQLVCEIRCYKGLSLIITGLGQHLGSIDALSISGDQQLVFGCTSKFKQSLFLAHVFKYCSYKVVSKREVMMTRD